MNDLPEVVLPNIQSSKHCNPIFNLGYTSFNNDIVYLLATLSSGPLMKLVIKELEPMKFQSIINGVGIVYPYSEERLK